MSLAGYRYSDLTLLKSLRHAEFAEHRRQPSLAADDADQVVDEVTR